MSKFVNITGPLMTRVQIEICKMIKEGKTKETISEDLRISLNYVYIVQREKCPECNPNKRKV